MKSYYCLLVCLMMLAAACNRTADYKNPGLPVEERVEDLVSRMTLEEKTSQMVYHAPAIERLDIPAYNWWNECLHGVARAGKATVFPQAIGMAATWNPGLIKRMADITSTEARAKYNAYTARGKRGIYQGLTFWSPNINIFRDPRWGRGMETYGEDPFLTGTLASAFIEGLQGNDPNYLKAIATSKHYAVHSGPEPLRHSFDAVISERDFRDTYFPAFKQTVEDAGVYSVMCAYNRYMGEPCCGSVSLQEDLLRGELGFDGYIVSDCGAIRDFYEGHNVVESEEEAAAMGVRAGTDLNCGDSYSALEDAVSKGILSEEEITVSVKRLMEARMRLGMFDPPDRLPWSDLSSDIVACGRHNRVALEMARESMVLLKNEDRTLPLSRGTEKIAVIGPNANDPEVLHGNYNGTSMYPVTPLEGIREAAEGEVRYGRGCDHASGIPWYEVVPSNVLFTSRSLEEPGVNARYFANLEADSTPVATRTETRVDYKWWDGSPMESLEDDHYSVAWTGVLVPPVSGTYHLGMQGKYFEFFLEGEKLVENSNVHHSDQKGKEVELEGGKPYSFRAIARDEQGTARFHLIWAPPRPDLEQEALDIARWSDHVILFMGLSPRLEGEQMAVEVEGFSGGDRTNLELPETQKDLIRRIVATGKPVTLVLLNGSALAIGWEDRNIPAILEAWYPGEAAGTAIADVLFGDYNPAGRLPVTFYRSVEDLPPFEDYAMSGRTYRYFRGDVLYPFGHGLSYTTFTYENLQLSKERIGTGEPITVSVDVTNTGDREGEEVVQVYIRDVLSEEVRPLIDLRGFQRISLDAGETRTVRIEIRHKNLAYYDPDNRRYRVESGEYEIFAGPSSDREKLIKTSLMVD